MWEFEKKNTFINSVLLWKLNWTQQKWKVLKLWIRIHQLESIKLNLFFRASSCLKSQHYFSISNTDIYTIFSHVRWLVYKFSESSSFIVVCPYSQSYVICTEWALEQFHGVLQQFEASIVPSFPSFALEKVQGNALVPVFRNLIFLGLFCWQVQWCGWSRHPPTL